MTNSPKIGKQSGVKHTTCLVRDHRGNGKLERLIRTINERLRANKQIVVTKDKSGLSEILYALRISNKKDGKLPFEKQLGREPNTVKSNVIGKFIGVLERDPNLEFEPWDLPEDLGSTVLVRLRARGSKPESSFDRKAAKIIKESDHTITALPENSGKPKVYSKRDVASSSAEQNKNNQPSGAKEKKASNLRLTKLGRRRREKGPNEEEGQTTNP